MSHRPQICFRFDVDSRRGLDVGVPNLLRLANSLDVAFTFFVHPGPMTDRAFVAKAAIAARRHHSASVPSHHGDPVVKLPLKAKLTVPGLVRVAVQNPKVGAGAPDRIRQILDAGSEVGLHGGRNHRAWQSTAQGWSTARVATELAYGLDVLHDAGTGQVDGFASPGWTSPPGLREALLAKGFGYVADRRTGAIETREGLVDIPTRIVGEPNGVGYLEWLRASGVTDDVEAVTDFRDRLRILREGGVAVAYDHPFWAGIGDLERLGRLVVTALDEGWEVVTMRRLAAMAT